MKIRLMNESEMLPLLPRHHGTFTSSSYRLDDQSGQSHLLLQVIDSDHLLFHIQCESHNVDCPTPSIYLTTDPGIVAHCRFRHFQRLVLHCTTLAPPTILML
jgi:hypothetical protein